MTEAFIPAEFHPPLEARVGQYVLRPLTEAYLAQDLAAVNASAETIRKVRGGTWPKGAITEEEDHADLVEHGRQFRERAAFAYSVLTQDERECAGCVYIYPPRHPFDDSDQSAMPADADAAVSMWVTRAAYETGFYPVLYGFVTEWIAQAWPFKRAYYSNHEAP
ncbi:MAG TPA: hypothetical protein VJR27_00880 [Candidatus Saccharimonadales bacterium]|nr:hypothetical protein [Candidatus Saccharimonadales bacterium]